MFTVIFTVSPEARDASLVMTTIPIPRQALDPGPVIGAPEHHRRPRAIRDDDMFSRGIALRYVPA